MHTATRPYLLKTALLLALLSAMPQAASAQGQPIRPSNDTAVRVAGLEQDLAILKRQIDQVLLDNEILRKENEDLRRQLQAVAAGGGSMDEKLAALRAQLIAEDNRNRSEIIAEVTRQIERLGSQTQSAINSVARQASSAAAAPAVSFSDDFPKTGITYTVVSGDTLSGIAKAHNSTVKDIQNANRIADPRDLKVGQTLFIPQR